MNSSPIAHNYNNHTHYSTPSRKPSEHHCNADKKLYRPAPISDQSLAPLCRVLFQDTDTSSRHNITPATTKLLRWFIEWWFKSFKVQLYFLTLYNQWILKIAPKKKYSAHLTEANYLPTLINTHVKCISSNTNKFFSFYLGKSLGISQILSVHSQSRCKRTSIQCYNRYNSQT